jgi:hypothetical protein
LPVELHEKMFFGMCEVAHTRTRSMDTLTTVQRTVEAVRPFPASGERSAASSPLPP